MAVKHYFWDSVNDCVLEETDEFGNVEVTYTREPGFHGPLVSEHRNGQTRQYHFDALGNTVALTDDSQNVTDTFVYDAWGNVVARSGTTPTPNQWLGQHGYQTSSATGKVYVRARTFDVTTGRWTSEDAAFPHAGPNPFAYGENAPTQKIDPSGLQCEPPSPCDGLKREEICDPAFAKKHGISTRGGGGVICCNGTAYPCLWPLPGFPDPGKCEEYDKCGMIHEEAHADTAKCDPNRKDPYRDKFNEDQKGDKIECQLRAKQLGCLCGKLRRRETNNDDCKKYMQKAATKQAEYVLHKENGQYTCPKSAVELALKPLVNCPLAGVGDK